MSEHTIGDQTQIQLPAPTFWPMVLAFGITLLLAGIVTHWAVSVVGFDHCGESGHGLVEDRNPIMNCTKACRLIRNTGQLPYQSGRSLSGAVETRARAAIVCACPKKFIPTRPVFGAVLPVALSWRRSPACTD